MDEHPLIAYISTRRVVTMGKFGVNAEKGMPETYKNNLLAEHHQYIV